MTEPDIPADPFAERSRIQRRHLRVLGARFEFASASVELLREVESAYAGLPTHTWGRRQLQCTVNLALTPGIAASRTGSEPRAPKLFSAADGTLCAVADESTFVTVSPANRAAIIAVAPRLLGFPYHLRHELIDLAVYLLVARCRELIPLHSACFSVQGRGILLTGASGAGKSTLALQWLAEGLDFVSEDSVLADPRTLHATGLANFLHLRADSLRFLGHAPLRDAILASPVIRRRSGVKKYEVDLRRLGCRIAARPPRIRAVVFASPQPAPAGRLLTALPHREVMARLRSSQPYALRQRGWAPFARSLTGIDAYELRRGRHPTEAIAALRDMLAKRGS